MISETKIHPSDFIYPLFVTEGEQVRTPIGSMPGQFRLSLDLLLTEVAESMSYGVRAIALFPAISQDKKDRVASESVNPDGLLQNTIRTLKKEYPDLLVISDVAMDPYSSDGHDGLVENGKINNDNTLKILADMAISQAEAGVDIVAPSDMMDGRIGYIRKALDEKGFTDVGIMAYTAKYASSFYGPFREALESAPKSSDEIPLDKKTYQMDPANSREASREAELDSLEGADIIMVKPALPYLDIVSELKHHSKVPVAAYQVSGEYAMIKAASEKGWLDENEIILESLICIKRAGADIILTYFAKKACQILSA